MIGGRADCLLQDVAQRDPIKQLEQSTPELFWPEYFAADPPADSVRRLIERLHAGKKHDQVIFGLRTALLAGQAEPWMYEVLALTMQIRDYPKAEVERVMLSMTDFNARDVPNLLGSAAYLVRLGADQQALSLYHQVAQLEPTRPEPYLLGLRLANRLKQVDDIIWSATGLLTYYWFDDFEKQHQFATQTLRDWQLRLKKSGADADAERVRTALDTALQRDLQIRLTWSGEADLDLTVNEPLGTVCSFSNRYTASGGALLHEGAGPNQAECYESYNCAFAATGFYLVEVSHASGNIVGNRARLEVIRYAGTDQEQTEAINIVFDKRDKKYRISLHNGRRTKTMPVFEPVKPTVGERKKRTQQTLAQLRAEMRQRSHPLFGQTFNQIGNPVGGGVGVSPVIQNVSSGVNLTAQASVSADRRYVRIGLQPSITQVTDVFTFTFLGGQ